MSFLVTVASFLFVLAIVVIVHELGHFLVARWCGVEVKTFSVGFGPEIAGFNDRRGTRWRVAAFPLGGYVRFLGDADAASTPDADGVARLTPEEVARSFPGQSVGKRAAIVAAGPIANFLLAIGIFAGAIYFFGLPVRAPLIETVEEGTPAEAAGLKPGDLILSIDGQKMRSFSDLQRKVSVSAGVPLKVTVRRAGEEVTLPVTPRLRETKGVFGTQRIGVLGILAPRGADSVKIERYGLGGSLWYAFGETWFVIERSGAFVAGLFAGRESADQLSGPLRIAKMSGNVAAEAGFGGLITLVAFLSISIGLMNLLPIPMLDGGHLLFYAIEAIRGRAVGEDAQEFGFKVGLALVVLLIMTVTVIDITALRSF